VEQSPYVTDGEFADGLENVTSEICAKKTGSSSLLGVLSDWEVVKGGAG
jgi:hypothetical protein